MASISGTDGTTTVAAGSTKTLTSTQGSGTTGTWSSSNTSIATVSNDRGNTVTVTGVSEGTVTITYTYGSGRYMQTDSTTVTVTDENGYITIYLYVQIIADTDVDISGWSLNSNDWYTVGYVKVPANILDLTNSSVVNEETVYNTSNLDILKEYLEENGFVAYDKNPVDIDEILEYVDWSAFKLCAGANDYVEDSSIKAFHLDGTLTLKKDMVHTLYYDDNVNDSSVINMPDTQAAVDKETTHDFTVSSTVPEREGYTFAGWNTEEDGSGEWYYGGSTIEVGTEETLYAIWTPVTTSVTVTKDWDDSDNTYGLRPDSVTVNLLKNGGAYTGENASVELKENNSWTYTWTGLAQSENGTSIVWSVSEDKVNYYESLVTGDAATGYTITNTLSMASVTVTKTVTGSMGDRNKNFSFTASVKGTDDADLTSLIAGNYVKDSDGAYAIGNTGSEKQDVSGGGFTLSDGESITFTVPVGTTFAVTETDNGTGYTTTVKVDDGEEKATSEAEVTVTATGANIEVINNREIKSPTGIFTEYLPYALMVMAALLGGVWLVNDRRKKIYVDREQ